MLPEDDIDVLAMVAHTVNMVYCRAIGDNSQVPWNVAPQWQRDSARNGVRAIIENPNQTPEQSHENWLKEKAETGWTYGPVKDAERKTHPCMVAYQDLPAEQRLKDSLFTGVVKELLAFTGAEE